MSEHLNASDSTNLSDLSDFVAYQKAAIETDQLGTSDTAVATFLHNLSDAVTSVARLITEQRPIKEGDDVATQIVTDNMARDIITERLGDVLWYVAAISGRSGISLGDVASRNIVKARGEWGQRIDDDVLFDADLPPGEQLPRRMSFNFRELRDSSTPKVMISTPLRDGGDIQLGDRISDNDHTDDGYRYHDCLHLAYVAILGWSPVIRALLRRKRKSVRSVDEVEDGARAILVEEALTAYVREHARRQQLFEHTQHLDYAIFREIKTQVKRLEVKARSFESWERAILEGYRVYRALRLHQGGIVTIDLSQKSIDFRAFDGV